MLGLLERRFGAVGEGAHRKRLSNGKPRPRPWTISGRSMDIRSTTPERWQLVWSFAVPLPSASSRQDRRKLDSVP
jgi:hypothetical protein